LESSLSMLRQRGKNLLTLCKLASGYFFIYSFVIYSMTILIITICKTYLTHFCSNYFVIYHQNECSIFGTVGKNGLDSTGYSIKAYALVLTVPETLQEI